MAQKSLGVCLSSRPTNQPPHPVPGHMCLPWARQTPKAGRSFLTRACGCPDAQLLTPCWLPCPGKLARGSWLCLQAPGPDSLSSSWVDAMAKSLPLETHPRGRSYWEL